MNTNTKFVLVPESEVPKLMRRRNVYYENPMSERQRIISDSRIDPRVKKNLSRDLLIRELARKHKLNPYKDKPIFMDTGVDNPMSDIKYRSMLTRDQASEMDRNETLDESIYEDPIQSTGWEESLPPFSTSSPSKSKTTFTSGYESIPTHLDLMAKSKRESDADDSNKDPDLFAFDDIIGKLMESGQLAISPTEIIIDGKVMKNPPRDPIMAWFEYMQGIKNARKPNGMAHLIRLMAKNGLGLELCLNPKVSRLYKDHMVRLRTKQSGKGFTHEHFKWLPWKLY